MLTAGATVRRMPRGDTIFTFSLAIAAAGIVAASLLASPAEARRWPHHAHHFARHPARHFARVGHRTHAVRYMRERPFAASRNFAAIVVDGNSGQTLYARAEDEP